jgi:hypothetical protein
VTDTCKFLDLFSSFFNLMLIFNLSLHLHVNNLLRLSFYFVTIVPEKWTSRCCSSTRRSIHSLGYVDGRGRRRPSTALPMAPPGIFFFV